MPCPFSLAGEEELKDAMEPSRYTGRAASQVEEYITGIVKPVKYRIIF